MKRLELIIGGLLALSGCAGVTEGRLEKDNSHIATKYEITGIVVGGRSRGKVEYVFNVLSGNNEREFRYAGKDVPLMRLIAKPGNKVRIRVDYYDDFIIDSFDDVFLIEEGKY